MSGGRPASSQLRAPPAASGTTTARPAEDEFDLAILASSECIKTQGRASPRRAPVALPPVVFSHLEDYVSTFQALILEECKAILAAAWLDANEGNEMNSNNRQDKVHTGCSFKVFYPRAGEDFCHMEVQKPGKSRLSLDTGQLVFVQEGGSTKGIAIVHVPISNSTYLLRTFAGTGLVNGNYDLLVMDNLTTARRAFISVSGLADFSPALRQQILNPLLNSEFVSWLTNSEECEAALASQQPWLSCTNFNQHQRLALVAVLRLQRGIFLMQGPPGTGKTATITGMVSALLHENPQTKILVCAPSNAASDEVGLRLMTGIYGREGKAYTPQRGWIVRLGPRSSVSKACHPITLDGILSDEKFSGSGSREVAEKDLVQNASVVCTTLSSCGHWYLDELKLMFDVVIIDEAVQAAEAEVLIALRRAKDRCVMIGDPCQLPATVFQYPAFAFRRSLFERMQEAGVAVHFLAIQYRMHKLISHFPSHQFYKGVLRDAPEVESRGWILDRWKFAFSRFQFRLHYYTFLDMRWGADEVDESHSRFNNDEAEAVVSVVRAILLSRKERIEVGVVTPYASQKARISRFLTDREKRYCEINTIDGFQGREKDAIVVSCVRAQQDKGLGFVSDERRMNVALTRAKSLLVIIGRAQTLERASPAWRALIEDACARGLYEVLQMPRGSSPTGHSRSERSRTRNVPELQEGSYYKDAELRRDNLSALAFSDRSKGGCHQTKFASREADEEGSRKDDTHRLEPQGAAAVELQEAAAVVEPQEAPAVDPHEIEAGTSKGRNLGYMPSQVQEAEDNKCKTKGVKLCKTLSSELQNQGGIQKTRHSGVSASDNRRTPSWDPRTVKPSSSELHDSEEQAFPRLHFRRDSSKQEKGLAPTSEKQSDISKSDNVESEMPAPNLSVQSKASDLQRRVSGAKLHNQNECLLEQSEAKNKKRKRDGAPSLESREVGSVKDGALACESDDHRRVPPQEPRTVEPSASELHGSVERAFPRLHVRGDNSKQEASSSRKERETCKSKNVESEMPAPDLAEENEAKVFEDKERKIFRSELQNQAGIRKTSENGASAYESDDHSRAPCRKPISVEPSSKLHDAEGIRGTIRNQGRDLVPTSEKESETSNSKNVESEIAPQQNEASDLKYKQDRALGAEVQNQGETQKTRQSGVTASEDDPRTVEPELHDAGERAFPRRDNRKKEKGFVPSSKKESETSKSKNVQSETPAPGLVKENEASLFEHKRDRVLGAALRKRQGAASLVLREVGSVKNRNAQHDVASAPHLQKGSETSKAADIRCKSFPTSDQTEAGCHHTLSVGSEAGEGRTDQKKDSCKSKTGEAGRDSGLELTEAGNCKRKKVKHGKAPSSGLQGQNGTQKIRQDGLSAGDCKTVEVSAAAAGKRSRKQEKGLDKESGSRKNKNVGGETASAPALPEQSEFKDLEHKKLKKHDRALGVKLHDQTEVGSSKTKQALDLAEQNEAANSKHKKMKRDRASNMELQNQRGKKNRNVEQSAAGDCKIVQHDGVSAPQLQEEGDHAAIKTVQDEDQARAQIGTDNRRLSAEQYILLEPEGSEATLKRKARRIRAKLRKLLEAKKKILEQLS